MTSALNVTVTAPEASVNVGSAMPSARHASMTRLVPRPETSMAPVLWNAPASSGLRGIERCSVTFTSSKLTSAITPHLVKVREFMLAQVEAGQVESMVDCVLGLLVRMRDINIEMLQRDVARRAKGPSGRSPRPSARSSRNCAGRIASYGRTARS